MMIEDVYTWPFDSVSMFLRYFVFAGMGYFVFYVWKRNTFRDIKIQRRVPSSRIIRNEILFSVFTIAIYCLMSALVFWWFGIGITRIYLDIDQFGYGYFILSVTIMVILHDAYFYWSHRFMHLPGVFQLVHLRHHLSTNPTPWAAFSFHPIEAIISVGIIPIIVFFIPCHPFALFAFVTIMIIINVMGHLGFELFPIRFMRHKMGQLQNTSTNHNIHHQTSRHNFGLYFTFWDKLMNTFSLEEK